MPQPHRDQGDGDVVHVLEWQGFDHGPGQGDVSDREQVAGEGCGEGADQDVDPDDKGRQRPAAQEHAQRPGPRLVPTPRQLWGFNAAPHDLGQSVTAAH